MLCCCCGNNIKEIKQVKKAQRGQKGCVVTKNERILFTNIKNLRNSLKSDKI